MKKYTIFLTVLIAMTITTKAQIPNNGFENWPLSTNGWPVGNPIQSIDIYPIGVGNYSLKLQNNAVPSPAYTDFGFCVTLPTPGSWVPSFSIIGHPNSFTGYYKFLPINSDTAVIAAVLYLNGDTVSSAFLRVSSSTPTWSSFNIPFTSYTLADSASLGFSAYNWYFGQSGMPAMQGNSELYIDNINFDNLISNVGERSVENMVFNLYPNPASYIVNLNINKTNNADLTLNIYNVIGTLVKSETLKQNNRQINISDLNNGVYVVTIKSKEMTKTLKLIIQR